MKGYKSFVPDTKQKSKPEGPTEKEKSAASEKVFKQLTRQPRNLPSNRNGM